MEDWRQTQNTGNIIHENSIANVHACKRCYLATHRGNFKQGDGEVAAWAASRTAAERHEALFAIQESVIQSRTQLHVGHRTTVRFLSGSAVVSEQIRGQQAQGGSVAHRVTR